MPSLGTIQRVVHQLDGERFAQVVGLWGQQVLAAYGKTLAGIGIDGKTLHGSATETLPALHLLSAFSQELRVVLGEVTVDGKTNEIKAIHPLLAELVLDGKVVTVDALLMQRDIAQAKKKRLLPDDGQTQPAPVVRRHPDLVRTAVAPAGIG